MSPGAILLAALLREEGHIDLDESEIGAEGEFARAAATLDRLLAELAAGAAPGDGPTYQFVPDERGQGHSKWKIEAIAGAAPADGPWCIAGEGVTDPADLRAAPADGPTRETVSAALDAAGCPSLGRWILHSSASEWDALNAGFRGGVAPASPGDFLRQHAAGVPDFAKLHAEHTARQLDEASAPASPAVREAAPGLLSAVPANPRTADKLGAAPAAEGER